MIYLSIIICTYNRCESLKDTLDSLLNQENDGSFNYEIIVVDNNSKDKTKKIVENYTPLFTGRLKYIHESTQGLSYARNKGIGESKGEIIAFTDDDCIVASDWILRIKEVFQNNPADCILGLSFLPNENGGTFARKPTNDLLIGNGLNMSFRKIALIDIGLFDTNLGAGSIGCSAEDTDIAYRLLSSKKRVLFSEKPKVTHKQRISPSEANAIIYRDMKGSHFFYMKHFITNGDIFVLKKIYRNLKKNIRGYLSSLKYKDLKKRKKVKNNIAGALAGMAAGTKFYVFKIK